MKTKLLGGPYRMPRCKVGGFLKCRIRGEVKVYGISAAPIAWPFTSTGHPTLIVCGDLVKAIRVESECAICHHFGVCPTSVWKWRKGLGVASMNKGTIALMSRNIDLHFDDDAKRKVIESTQRPERNAKIAAARRGKPRPAHVVEAVRKANLGRKLPRAQRAKMSAAHRTRGTYPPAAGVPWTAKEDALLGTIPDADVARRTGRTIMAVGDRRRALGIYRYKRKRKKGRRS